MAQKSKPTVYADTSFLFSLYLRDANTAGVFQFLKANPTPLAFTAWQRLELRNAFRLSVFRGHHDQRSADEAIRKVDGDIALGNLADTALVWPVVLDEAELLSARHATPLGVRALDLLHVAAARTIGTGRFVTCDGRQLALAQAAGLRADKV